MVGQPSIGEHLVAAAALGPRRRGDGGGLQERLAHGDLEACAETHLVSVVEEGETPAFLGVRRRGARKILPVVAQNLVGVIWVGVLGFDNPRPALLWRWSSERREPCPCI